MAAGYLIDTSVISELGRRLPEPRVVQWFAERPAGQLFLSVLTLGEIRRGVERLEPSERQQALREWLERELPAIDSLLAATAMEHNAAGRPRAWTVVLADQA